MLLRSEAYIKLACGATKCSGAQLLERATGLGVALRLEVSGSEVDGCLIWQALLSSAAVAVCWMSCWEEPGTIIRYGSGLVAEASCFCRA